jgi:hypothetical protein
MASIFFNGLDLKGTRLQHLADGTVADDAVTLQQLQAFVRGLSVKGFARAASTANISLAAPGATLDGVTLANGDVVLLKNQTAGAENGPYVWNGASTPLVRTADTNTAALMRSATLFVTEGTTNADKAWTQITDNVTLGTTALTFTPFGGGTIYTAGNGVSLSGGAFAVALDTASGLIVSGTGLKADGSMLVKKYAAVIGDGTTTSIAVVHNLGTTDITWSLRYVSTGQGVDTDWSVTDANTLTFTFAAAPASTSLRVVVHG